MLTQICVIIKCPKVTMSYQLIRNDIMLAKPRPGGWFNITSQLTSIGNPIVETRRFYDRLISLEWDFLLVKWHLYIESGPKASMSTTISDYNQLVVCSAMMLGFMLSMWVLMALNKTYRQVSNIRCTKFQHLKDSRTVLRLSLSNPLKPDVKSKMKM